MALAASSPPVNPHPNPMRSLPPLIPRKAPRDHRTEPSSDPPPDTPDLPAPITKPSERAYSTPVRRIISPHDHDLFLQSPTYSLILGFVFGLSDSARGLCMSDVKTDTSRYHPAVKAVLRILEEAGDLLQEYPPEDTGSRFGNKVFREYMAAVEGKAIQWHSYFCSGADFEPTSAVAELATYFDNSFGSPSRLDYGSGHELNFACWLLCLQRLGYFVFKNTTASEAEREAEQQHVLATIALVVFPAYWQLMRRVQGAYYLEPAGSHGVWGLDDYQFLPFLFGAAQLVAPLATQSNPIPKPKHPFLTPKAIHSAPLLDDYGNEYLYLSQVQHINSVKTVEGLRWHSPMLDDISAAKNWGKIEAGMKKMFVKEVLGKRAVMQHFLFGSLIAAVEGMSPADGGDVDDSECGGEGVHPHTHDHDGSLDDPCGIKVPGAVGASIEMRRKGGQEALRRLPFD